MKFASVFMVFVSAGCSSHYSVSDLAGKYVLFVDGGIDTIELKAGGNYTHTYQARNGAVHHQENTWTLEELQAGPTVGLNNFRSLSQEEIQKSGSYHLLLVKRSYRDLYLITNIDLNEGYRKQ